MSPATNKRWSAHKSCTVAIMESSLSISDEVKDVELNTADISIFRANMGSNMPGKNSPKAAMFNAKPRCLFINVVLFRYEAR